ncbi:hypothetical protein FACS189490_11410 [Clostridia bacterium]|nr:hypothetical protein FACS189490_11410 [Clostridia bacterium]
MGNVWREVHEGWTPQDFIDSLSWGIKNIMEGDSWRVPFATREELVDYIIDHQPYYKESIPEVNDYFCELYNLK